MVLKELFSKRDTSKEKFSQMQEDLRLQQILANRQKNANERELERFGEEDRQEAIKAALVKIRKQRQQKAMKTTVLNSDFNVLKDKSILKDQNMFMGKSNMMSKGMFFK